MVKSAQSEDFEKFWQPFWEDYKNKNSENVLLFEAVIRYAFWAGWLSRRQFECDLPILYGKPTEKTVGDY